MAASVAVHVETGALVIGLRGRLTVAQAELLRRAFARCARHCPPYIVVDCCQVPPAGLFPALLPALIVVRSTRRPGLSVLVCAPTSALRRVLRRIPTNRVALYPRLADALRDVRPHHVPDKFRRAHLRLAPTPTSARVARRMVRECCDLWQIPEAADTGELVVSELVANAVEHAGTDIDVTVCRRRHHLRIAVADRHPSAPDFAGALTADRRPLSTRGRGLALVAGSAARCGVLNGSDGKMVWASIAVRAHRIHLPRLPAALRGRAPAWLPLPAARYRPRPA